VAGQGFLLVFLMMSVHDEPKASAHGHRGADPCPPAFPLYPSSHVCPRPGPETPTCGPRKNRSALRVPSSPGKCRAGRCDRVPSISAFPRGAARRATAPAGAFRSTGSRRRRMTAGWGASRLSALYRAERRRRRRVRTLCEVVSCWSITSLWREGDARGHCRSGKLKWSVTVKTRACWARMTWCAYGEGPRARFSSGVHQNRVFFYF